MVIKSANWNNFTTFLIVFEPKYINSLVNIYPVFKIVFESKCLLSYILI